MNLFENQVAAKFTKHIVAASRVLADSTSPASPQGGDHQPGRFG